MKSSKSFYVATRAFLKKAALLSIILSVPAPAHVRADTTDNTEIPSIISRLRATYEREAATKHTQALALDSQWVSSYGDAVARFTQEAQARGDFDVWQAGSEERKRFEEQRDITAAHLVETPEGLRTLQQRAVEGRIKLRRKAARDTIELTEKLVARLESMTRELTIRGDADGARETIKAIAEIRAHEIYSEALFNLDAGEPFPPQATRNPAQPAENFNPAGSDPPNRETAAANPAPDKVSLFRRRSTPAVSFSIPGEPPVSAPGTRLFMLAATDAVEPGASPVSVSARYLMRENQKFSLNGQSYELDLTEVQVGLKARPDVERIERITVAVQYFSSRTRGEPFPVQYALIQLAAVDGRMLYMQLPPLSHQIQMVPSALGGSRPYADRTLQFRGVAITIFDEHGAVINQSVSDRSLLELAGDSTRYNEDGTLKFP